MFIKLIISFLFITSINLISDETVSMESDGTVAEFNYLTVTDPASFMMALDRFDKSDCAKKWREESGVAVSLWSLRGSGSSHFILVVYENYEMMEKGRAIFSSCKDSAYMIKSFQDNTDTERSWNWISENLVAARAWTNNTAFAKYNFNIEPGHESDYMNSWKNFMSSQLNTFDGSFGLNRIAYGNRYVSHMVYLGADSMDKLDKGIKLATSSKEFMDFASDVSSIRQNINVELVQLVKFYTGE